MKTTDVVVLGAGPGGYVAAIRARQLGLRVAIVERRLWGGVCLNIGCIPSKALLRNAEIVRLLRTEAAAFGIALGGGTSFDYGEAFRRSRRVADGRARGVRYLMRKNQIDELEGAGTFLDPHTLRVHGPAGTETVRFTHAIIATGASPRALPGVPLGPRVVTYEGQILAEGLPRQIVIIGGGAIGVEMATVMEGYGVGVTIVEAAARLLPTEDEEISAVVARQLERRGVVAHVGARVRDVAARADDVTVTIESSDGATISLEADRVLVAIGFSPNSAGLGLEAAGVAIGARGEILTDPDLGLRTSAPHIHAIGDVTGHLMLAHAAEAMAMTAAEAIAGLAPAALDYESMPRATFCHPQVASFGPTEAQARARGLDVDVAKFPFQANGKAQGLGDYAGFVKLIGERGTGRLIAAHLVGPEVTELLPELTLAKSAELTAHEVARNVHAHPTLGEAVKDAAHALGGHAINL